MNDTRLVEYFELKNSITVFKSDLKDLIENHSNSDSIEDLKIELKKLRDEIKNDDDVKVLSEKIKDLKERSDLLKEIILIEMKKSGQDRIEYEGKEIIIKDTLKIHKIK